MPQKGTKINVYFPGAEAKQVMAMTLTRGCGEEIQKNTNMSKPTEKVMKTKWGYECLAKLEEMDPVKRKLAEDLEIMNLHEQPMKIKGFSVYI
jgi:hypothetical protein